uniref:DUF2382 domain-containing protein n=1 Tax=Parastrongyloides trichosuri TaxID=131310 RepID=A0A0N4Z1Y3_PARTI
MATINRIDGIEVHVMENEAEPFATVIHVTTITPGPSGSGTIEPNVGQKIEYDVETETVTESTIVTIHERRENENLN